MGLPAEFQEMCEDLGSDGPSARRSRARSLLHESALRGQVSIARWPVDRGFVEWLVRLASRPWPRPFARASLRRLRCSWRRGDSDRRSREECVASDTSSGPDLAHHGALGRRALEAARGCEGSGRGQGLARVSAQIGGSAAERRSPSKGGTGGISPLHLACEAGGADLVRLLASTLARAWRTVEAQRCPALTAARRGDVDVSEKGMAVRAT